MRLAARGYQEVMARCARELAQRWRGRAEVSAAEEMDRLTLDVVTRTLFGADLSGEAERIRAAMAVIQETIIREMGQAVLLPDWLPLPGKIRQRRAIRYLHGLVEGLIRARRADPQDRGDLLSLLLSAVAVVQFVYLVPLCLHATQKYGMLLPWYMQVVRYTPEWAVAAAEPTRGLRLKNRSADG